ncbi:MAG: hypothetical protein JWN23_2268 [Rhodocyclales bacterium]|nr:hypothetical protein [Rhodocyclales bacterium]
MQTPRQVFSSDFVYLLHAAAQQPRPAEPLIADGEEEEDVEELDEEELDEESRLKEINFDD